VGVAGGNGKKQEKSLWADSLARGRGKGGMLSRWEFLRRQGKKEVRLEKDEEGKKDRNSNMP